MQYEVMLVLAGVILLLAVSPVDRKPVIKRRGLEMKATKGRLTHIRQTGSDVEL